MATTQHPVRGVGPDPKGDSLVAIKKWLIRDPSSAETRPLSDLSYSATSDRSIARKEIDDAVEVPGSDCTAGEKELDDAPGIAEASEPSINLILSERANAARTNAAVTQEAVGCRVIQGDEVQEGRSAFRKLLLRMSVCVVLLLAAMAFWALEGFPYLEERSIFSSQDLQSASAPDRSLSSTLQHQLDVVTENFGSVQQATRNAWNHFRNWSTDELHAVLHKRDVGAVAERSETTARNARPAPAVDRPLSSQSLHQFGPISEDLGILQRAAINTWTRLRDWSSQKLQAVLPQKNVDASFERQSASVTASVTPSAGVTPSASVTQSPAVAPSSISEDVKSAQTASSADRASSSELQRRLDAMTENLSNLQRMVAELTGKQEQINKDIETLQTAQQNINQKLSALPRSWGAGTPRKALRRHAY